MPVPLPVNQTSTHAAKAAAKAAANATAAAAGAAKAAAAHAAQGGLGAVKQSAGHLLGGAASQMAKSMPNILAIALFVIIAGAVILPLLMVFFYRRLHRLLPQPRYKMSWLYYDPVENKMRYVVLWRIAPNIYASEDGVYIALARHQAQPVTLDMPLDKDTLKKNGDKALIGVKIGDVVLNTDKTDEVVFTLFGEQLGRVEETAKLILLLKEKGIINDIVISPNMSIIVSADKAEMARYLATALGDLAADTMIDVAAMTGSRQEFQYWVKQLVELEKERLETVEKSVNRMALVAFALIVVMGLIYLSVTAFLGK